MGVDHGCRHVGVAEELLDGADVVAGFEQMGGKTVAQGVAGGGFRDACFQNGSAEGALGHGFVKVVAAVLAGGAVTVLARSGEHPLPRPRLGAAGVLFAQRAGQCDAAGATREVGFVELACGSELFSEHSTETHREHGSSVFSPFSLADDEVAGGEVDVFHS